MERRAPGTPLKHYSGDDRYDAIVIGSGIGGLGVAALLAKQARKRVLVLERHYTAGGMTHVFRRPGSPGTSACIHRRHARGRRPRRLLDHLTEGRLEWAPMPEAYDRVRVGEFAFDYVRGKERLRQALQARFPSERKAIDRYFSLVDAVGRRAAPSSPRRRCRRRSRRSPAA